MGRFSHPAIGFVAAVLLLPVPAPGFIGEISIAPPEPVEGDRIAVTISGSNPTPCWVNGEPLVSMSGKEIRVVIPQEALPVICIQVLHPYSVVANLGILPAGSYLLAVEDAQSAEEIVFEVAVSSTRAFASKYVVCDPNGDGETDLADAVFLLLHLFAGGAAPACPRQADANADGKLDLSDSVYILDYLFLGGPAPAAESACEKNFHCGIGSWIIDCPGHWECDCGECQMACEFERCGDGRCDAPGGENFESCATDCERIKCAPICDKIGTRSEGWYDPCTGKLIRWDFCAGCQADCGPFREGQDAWYDSCTGEPIAWPAEGCR